MSDNVCSKTEIVGSSEIRGEVRDSEVGHVQVTLAVGVTLQDTKS